MNWRRLAKRITNLDRLYLQADGFTEAYRNEPLGSVERRELEKIADRYWKRYATLRDDMRRTSA
jgi:hypothetical protein